MAPQFAIDISAAVCRLLGICVNSAGKKGESILCIKSLLVKAVHWKHVKSLLMIIMESRGKSHDSQAAQNTQDTYWHPNYKNTEDPASFIMD